MVTASDMGRKGGSVKSDAKTRAARKNAAKPRGKWVTAIAYKLTEHGGREYFGVAMLRGKIDAASEAAFQAVLDASDAVGVDDLETVVQHMRVV